MPFCGQCGAELTAGKKFCGDCGAAIDFSAKVTSTQSLDNTRVILPDDARGRDTSPNIPDTAWGCGCLVLVCVLFFAWCGSGTKTSKSKSTLPRVAETPTYYQTTMPTFCAVDRSDVPLASQAVLNGDTAALAGLSQRGKIFILEPGSRLQWWFETGTVARVQIQSGAHIGQSCYIPRGTISPAP